MINLSSVVMSPAFKKTMQRIRVTSVLANEGELTRTEDSTDSIDGTIMPASQGDLVEFKIEGEQTNSFAILYVTPDTDVVWADGEGIEGDLIIDKGTKYRAYGGRNFRDYGYIKVLLQKVAQYV